MFSLFKKEISSFLSSLIGYIVITVFLLINGLFLWVFPGNFNILDYGYAQLDGLFMLAPFVFLFLIPAITMRSFAEERRSGTLEMLLTKPLSDTQIVLAKFFAGLALVIFSLLPTLVYYYTVYQLGLPSGNLDSGGIWGSYIGLLFLAGAFISIGLFISSITDNQIAAFLLSVFVSGFFYIGFEFIYSLFDQLELFFKYFGINTHYTSMSRGVIDSRDLIYFLSIISIFLLLTKLSVESRKWARKTSGKQDLIWGFALIALGVGAIRITYWAADANEWFVLYYAVILAGIIRLIGGLIVSFRKKVKLESNADKGINTRKKSNRRFAYGLAIVILLNIIGNYSFFRLDLTSEKRYTISKETKELVKNLDDIVFFTIYLDGDLPSEYKSLRNATREMLDELHAYNKDIQYDFVNPSANEDEQERQKFYQQLAGKDLAYSVVPVDNKDGYSEKIIFHSALLSYKNKEFPLNLLVSEYTKPKADANDIKNSIQTLELSFFTAIRKLTNPDLPKIAFIDGHGELDIKQTYDLGSSLGNYYNTVDRVEIGGKLNALAERKGKDSVFTNIYELLIIAKPDTIIGEKDRFLIDQHIMRGGKVLWMIDPMHASMDSLQYSNSTMGIRRNLGIERMLFNYGVRLNPDLILNRNALEIGTMEGVLKTWDFFPHMLPYGDHPVSSGFNIVKSNFVSTMDTVGPPSIKKTILLETDSNSRVLPSPAYISTFDILYKKPELSLYNQPALPTAVLLEGNFSSVFQNRIAPEIAFSKEMNVRFISDSTAMIVVADGDVAKNQMTQYGDQIVPMPLGYDRFTDKMFDNKKFILNAVNYLCGDEELISLRGKNVKIRLLNKKKIQNSGFFWKSFSTSLPVVLVIVFGLIQLGIRRRKFTRGRN